MERRAKEIRHHRSKKENHLIDTYRGGGNDRRECASGGHGPGRPAGTTGSGERPRPGRQGGRRRRDRPEPRTSRREKKGRSEAA